MWQNLTQDIEDLFRETREQCARGPDGVWRQQLFSVDIEELLDAQRARRIARNDARRAANAAGYVATSREIRRKRREQQGNKHAIKYQQDGKLPHGGLQRWKDKVARWKQDPVRWQRYLALRRANAKRRRALGSKD